MAGSQVREKQRLLRLRASDGNPVSGLLVTKDYVKLDEVLDTPILLQIHGLLGHFLARGTPRLLPHALLERGFSSMSLNTRLAFAGQFTGKGIFDDTLMDIDAVLKFLNDTGFNKIYILGYSLGASILAYWMADRGSQSVRGIVLEGIHYSTSQAQRARLEKWGGSPTYEEIYERAKAVLGDDPRKSKRDEIFVVYRARGPTPEPTNNEIFTYKTWWFMMGPHAYGAMAHKHIPKIKTPILFLRGENDFIVDQWEVDELVRIAKEAGNERIRLRVVPGARHDCMENPEVMVNEVVSFINSCS
jgi:alpha-beta hydrolase superfamily lysophospholipase